jgi:hypothetical protein
MMEEHCSDCIESVIDPESNTLPNNRQRSAGHILELKPESRFIKLELDNNVIIFKKQIIAFLRFLQEIGIKIRIALGRKQHRNTTVLKKADHAHEKSRDRFSTVT